MNQVRIYFFFQIKRRIKKTAEAGARTLVLSIPKRMPYPLGHGSIMKIIAHTIRISPDS